MFISYFWELRISQITILYGTTRTIYGFFALHLIFPCGLASFIKASKKIKSNLISHWDKRSFILFMKGLGYNLTGYRSHKPSLHYYLRPSISKLKISTCYKLFRNQINFNLNPLLKLGFLLLYGCYVIGFLRLDKVSFVPTLLAYKKLTWEW